MSSTKAAGKTRAVTPPARGGRTVSEKRQAAQIKDWLAQIERARQKAEGHLTEIERLKGETRAILTKLMAA